MKFDGPKRGPIPHRAQAVAAMPWEMAGVLHTEPICMQPADNSTTIRKGADWGVGVRLRTGQGTIDLSGYTMRALIYGVSGAILKTIDGVRVATDCMSFLLTHTETTAMGAQNGRWEVWGTRTEDDYKMLLVSGRATIV